MKSIAPLRIQLPEHVYMLLIISTDKLTSPGATHSHAPQTTSSIGRYLFLESGSQPVMVLHYWGVVLHLLPDWYQEALYWALVSSGDCPEDNYTIYRQFSLSHSLVVNFRTNQSDVPFWHTTYAPLIYPVNSFVSDRRPRPIWYFNAISMDTF